MNIKQIIAFDRKYQDKIIPLSAIIGIMIVLVGAAYFGAKLNMNLLAKILCYTGLVFLVIAGLNLFDKLSKVIEGKK